MCMCMYLRMRMHVHVHVRVRVRVRDHGAPVRPAEREHYHLAFCGGACGEQCIESAGLLQIRGRWAGHRLRQHRWYRSKG